MADAKGDGAGGIVAAFGEHDGGHSFVTLCDAVESEKIHEVVPQEDIHGTVEALRNGTAQVAVVPLMNSITQTDSATLAALASGEVKILGRVRRSTNHVLVGIKDYINAVDVKFQGSYGHEREGASSQISLDVEPGPKALARFVLLLRKVFASKSVYDQTRGKLTGSDFRHDIQVEHTANPVRVLLRYYRDRETGVVWDGLEGLPTRPLGGQSAGPAPGPQVGQGGTIQFPTLGQQQAPVRPLDANFFSAAMVAEGLLTSAQKVCGLLPGQKRNRLCSQRLSEINATLRELQTDSDAPRDLPNNVTTFLVVAAKSHKGGVVWEDGRERRETVMTPLQDDLARLTEAGKKLDPNDPKTPDLKAKYAAQIKAIQAEIDGVKDLAFGPSKAECSWRATFLLKLSAEGDWDRALKAFKDKAEVWFPECKLKFDQAPDRLTHNGKPVLLVSAFASGIAAEGMAKTQAEKIEKRLNEHAEKVKKGETGRLMMPVFSDKKPDDFTFEPKILGVYPAWAVSGVHRTWAAEPEAGKDVKKADKKPLSLAGIALFMAFWFMIIFFFTLLSTSYGQAWIGRMWNLL
jgi:hypothetical protein